MTTAIGNATLLLGLLASIFGAATNIAIARTDRTRLIKTANIYLGLIVVAALGAFVTMQVALFSNNFSIAFVANHSARSTPTLFKFATLWSALEGSILLWILVLALLIAATAWQFRASGSDALLRWALAVTMGVSAFFFALLIGPARPFSKVGGQIPIDGPGPNPLLQNHPLMAFHPPMLYLGYVGFTIPFAFAIAALITNRVGEGWLLATRRWTLIAWGCLSIGILLGAWWSYEVLGWGGFWGWDPVENASLVPWLTATAFIHSVLVQERRGMLRVWNLSLVCATFSLTILGTFLTRSGVLDSVHAFSAGSVGGWLLAFFAVITLGSVALIGWRGQSLRTTSSIESPLSREAAFLANNLLFAVFALVVLLGTTFPLLIEALNSERITVGRPYFDRMTLPIVLVMLFLMAVAPVLPWGKTTGELVADRLKWPAAFGVAVMVLSVVGGLNGAATIFAFGLGAFASASATRQLVLAIRRNGVRGITGRANGGMVAHLGIIVICMAIAASTSYATREELRLEPGQSGVVGGQTITYLGSTTQEYPNKTATKFTIRLGGDSGPTFAPAIQRFSTQTIAVPSVQTGVFRDVYLTIVQPPVGDDPTVVIGVIIQPMQVWLWIGGAIVGLGTLLALIPSKRRQPAELISV
jgi:cytochrome c-type biogenesis protein CcmF